MNAEATKRRNIQVDYKRATDALKVRLDDLCYDDFLPQWRYFLLRGAVPDDVSNWRKVSADYMSEYDRLAPEELRKIESVAKRAVSAN